MGARGVSAGGGSCASACVRHAIRSVYSSEESRPDIGAKATMAPTPIQRRACPGLCPTHRGGGGGCCAADGGGGGLTQGWWVRRCAAGVGQVALWGNGGLTGYGRRCPDVLHAPTRVHSREAGRRLRRWGGEGWAAFAALSRHLHAVIADRVPLAHLHKCARSLLCTGVPRS